MFVEWAGIACFFSYHPIFIEVMLNSMMDLKPPKNS